MNSDSIFLIQFTSMPQSKRNPAAPQTNSIYDIYMLFVKRHIIRYSTSNFHFNSTNPIHKVRSVVSYISYVTCSSF